MTIEELSMMSNVSVSTIKKNLNKVRGASVKDGGIFIEDGTRYPYDAHRHHFDNIEKRRYALLDATYRYRYVDAETLKNG